jgi:hypothetical protein
MQTNQTPEALADHILTTAAKFRHAKASEAHHDWTLLCALVDRLRDMAASGAKECAALQRDAERYHVLRNRDYDFVVEQDRPGWRTTLPVGRGLDEAIDAATKRG